MAVLVAGLVAACLTLLVGRDHRTSPPLLPGQETPAPLPPVLPAPTPPTEGTHVATAPAPAGLDFSHSEMTVLAGGMGQKGATDGTGTEARFYSPKGMATDGSSLFVCDPGNHSIRKVDLGSGEVSTLAGELGSKGFQDGSGEEARFAFPSNLARIGGLLYVTDSGNHAIRTVDIQTGETRTLAGRSGRAGKVDGDFSAASFYWPDGIAVWRQGLVLVDGNNHCIRYLDLQAQTTRTLAGVPGRSGNADGSPSQFRNPVGISVDGDNAYIADYNNAAIRRLDLRTGNVDSLQVAGLLHPANTLVVGQQLVLTDYGGNCIYCGSVLGGNMTRISASGENGENTNEPFNGPTGMLFLGHTLFLTDQRNHVIRRFEFQ